MANIESRTYTPITKNEGVLRRLGRATSKSIVDSFPISLTGLASVVFLPNPWGLIGGGLALIGEVRSGFRAFREEFSSKASRTPPSTARRIAST